MKPGRFRRALKPIGELFGSPWRHRAAHANTGPGTGLSLFEQAQNRGVKNKRVLAAVAAVPRQIFMAEGNRGSALVDEAFPIGEGQTISQPTLVARMTELLDPKPEDNLLEIGAGSGYQAALLSRLARQVHAIEILPGLADTAAKRLAGHGFNNVFIHLGDGYLGWPGSAPYDGIMISCAVDRIPEPLVGQLKEGGRMVLPLGGAWLGQRLTLVTKLAESQLRTEQFMGVQFVPLTGPHGTGA
jgi:protein-L-isoaspartate(D-aspartate) O-methyltransferase